MAEETGQTTGQLTENDRIPAEGITPEAQEQTGIPPQGEPATTEKPGENALLGAPLEDKVPENLPMESSVEVKPKITPYELRDIKLESLHSKLSNLILLNSQITGINEFNKSAGATLVSKIAEQKASINAELKQLSTYEV